MCVWDRRVGGERSCTLSDDLLYGAVLYVLEHVDEGFAFLDVGLVESVGEGGVLEDLYVDTGPGIALPVGEEVDLGLGEVFVHNNI